MKRIFLAVFLVFSIAYSNSQEFGFPLLKNYSTKEYNASPQVFSIVQDSVSNILYFGVVEYGIICNDGAKWKQIPMPNNSATYGMCQHKDGKIYAGSIDNFGVLETTDDGKIFYKDLTYLIADTTIKIGSVFSIANTDDYVYFRTPENIFEYEPTTNKINIYNCGEDGVFRGDFIYNNTFFTRLTKKGMMKIQENVMLPTDNFSIFTNDHNFNKAFIYKDKTIFLPTRTSGLFSFNVPNFDNFTKIENIYPTFFEDNNIYCAKVINDSLFSLGSMKKGCLIFDKQNNTDIIDENNLLQNNNVRTIQTDYNKNLWLGLDNGITKTDYSFDWTFWNKQNGLKNFVLSVIRHKGIIYVATFQNVYYINTYNQPIEITDIPAGENWMLYNFKLEETELLLAATQSGIFEINGTTARQIYTGGAANCICQSQIDSRRIYSTDFHDLLGLITLKYENNNWTYQGKLEGVKDEIRGIIEDKNGTLWAGTYTNGIIKITINQNDILNPQKVEYYKQQQGIPDLNSCLPYLYKDYILVATKKGIYFYNEKSDKFEKFTIFGDKFADGSTDVAFIKETQNGDIFLASWDNKNNDIYILLKDADNKFILYNSPFCRLPQIDGIETIYCDSDNIFWVGGSDGLFRYDQKLDIKNYKLNFPCHIREIKIGEDSTIFYGNKINNKILQNNIKIDYTYNNISFYFAAPFYDQENQTKYSYILEGFEDNWSNWDLKTEKEYSFLPIGKYIFIVKAKNIYGIESIIDKFAFQILPPWYRTWLAYLIYFCLFILFLFAIIKLFTRRLIKQKEKLEIIVKERTIEISEKNEELHQQNEEITAQKEELERINLMLEKLSIVASETDNAVIIMDKDGNFEWINDGFTRLYGYNFDEFISKLGKNMFEASTNKDIQNILEKAKTEKISVTYESNTNTKNGEIIYVQTTLTPIIDINNKIVKFVAIDTDIRKIKEAEREIIKQKDELKIKNEMIHGSIRYAQTIQTAILPIKQNIDKCFDNFIIFRPKDIVSGDFYWYSQKNYELGIMN